MMQTPSIAEAIQHAVPLILDGAMGTMRLSLGAAYNATAVHRSYLEAGAQIITADTVGLAAAALAVVQDGTSAVNHICHRCSTAVQAALTARDEFCRSTPGRTIWVAGSLGPVAPQASESNLPELDETYRKLVQCMAAAGVNLILIETATSARQAKAAARAVAEVAPFIPFAISATPTGQSDRQLIPQIADIAKSFHALAAGLNCVEADACHFELLQQMAKRSGLPTIFYPSVADSATPAEFAQSLLPLLKSDRLGIIGGCCGTSPAHISALTDLTARYDVLGDAKK